MAHIVDIEVVEDLSAGSRLDEGFLRLRRLRVRNRYADGTCSATYACDVQSRRSVDAVALVLYSRDAAGEAMVLLRTATRPPITLRSSRTDLVQPDAGVYLALPEIVAGLLEEDDVGRDGIARRAAIEAREEAGFDLAPADCFVLGGAFFPSPGTSDEKVHLMAAEVDFAQRGEPEGDGSIMELDGELLVLPLAEALAACRSGAIPDAKTEIALARLEVHLAGR